MAVNLETFSGAFVLLVKLVLKKGTYIGFTKAFEGNHCVKAKESIGGEFRFLDKEPTMLQEMISILGEEKPTMVRCPVGKSEIGGQYDDA